MIEDKIVNLCTRATKLFVNNNDDIVSVGIASIKDCPNFWQVWFTMNSPKGHISHPVLDNGSLMEDKTLSKALDQLHDWLLIHESKALYFEAQGAEIAELIGYGD